MLLNGTMRDGGITRWPVWLGALSAVVLGLLSFPSIRNNIAFGDGSLIMAGATVASGVAGAILLEIAGRLAQHRRATWTSAALALYSVTIVPFSVVQTVSEQIGVTPSMARLVTYWAVIGLFALAVCPPRIAVGSVSWVLVGGGLLLALATAEVSPLVPGPVHGLVRRLDHVAMSSTVTQAALVTVLYCLGVVLVVHGWQERNGPLRGLSLGLFVIAAAHLGRIAAGVPISKPKLVFSVYQLIGLTLVLLVSVRLTRSAWHALRVQDNDRHIELRARAANLERMTQERDHELRNGLAGIAGFCMLLSGSLGADASERLRKAVASELHRLEAMLENRCLDSRPEAYLVAPVLTDLVTLYRAAGRDVELDFDERLRVIGSPEILAQVVANLLANCDRHAPGSRVRISARVGQERVFVEVADNGPGIPPGLWRTVLDPSTRSGTTAGSGLGLYICHQLLTAQGGVLRVLSPRPGQTGCTVLIELPAATQSPTTDPVIR